MLNPGLAKVFLGLLVLLGVEIIPTVSVLAQAADIASVYEIADPQAEDGDLLVITSDQGLVRATKAYDTHLFGVLQTQPLFVYRRFDNLGKPIARSGIAKVSVTTLGGAINVGDYITSSEIPGKGQRGAGAGYVVGVALSSLGENDGQQIDFTPQEGSAKKVTSGTISVALKIEYAESSGARSPSQFLNTFSSALFTNIKDPDKFMQIFKYIMAGAAIVVSFALGFFTFSRSIPKGIEAIGRNPLAEKAIIFSLVLNVIFTILTVGAGIIAAVFILRL